jgi:GNAT superfamily N-acetyltransferase
MPIVIGPDHLSSLVDYGTISAAFSFSDAYEVRGGPGPSAYLTLRRGVRAGVVDYDDLSVAPADWARMFDISRWLVLAAFDDGRCVGGATVACLTPDLKILEGRSDLDAVSDVRVWPNYRKRGVATVLLRSAASQSLSAGIKYLKVETQNTNVSACRLYSSTEFRLVAANPNAYRGESREWQLTWLLDLRCTDSPGAKAWVVMLGLRVK